jgi:cytoskeleton protein RodZ
MAEGSAINVGARLREAREKKGVSLRQIATTTRISMISLEALERNDPSRLPGGIFTRAFIRAYAQEVDLDPERIIQDFIAQFPSDSVAAGTRHAAQMEDHQAFESDRRAVETAVRLVLVSLPIAAIVIYFGMREGFQSPSPAPAAVVHSSVPAGRGDVAPAPPLRVPAGPAARAEPAFAGLTMAIAPQGSCWVSVSIDGEQSFSGLMKAGDQRQVAARQEIGLTVGDAGMFAYQLNGVTGRPLGAPGAVVSARITLANYKEFLVP